MLIRKGFKFQLRTDAASENALARFGGSCRFVWNKALAIQKERLHSEQKVLNYSELCDQLKKWKAEEDTAWLAGTHSQPLQQTMKNLDRAIKDAFNKRSDKKFPRFKKKGRGDSFRFPQGFKVEGDRIYLPKIGWMRFRKSRDIEGTPKNVAVSEYNGKWFVSIQCEIEIGVPVHEATGRVGIDMGVNRFATLSDGSFYEPLNSFKKLEKRLAKAQRKLARQVKFSANWQKQKRRIARIHFKIANARRDYLHKASTMISKKHAVVVLEDLKVSNMSASAKGTILNPGKNVAAKSGLNKAILDQGWSKFRRQLEYKQHWRGGTVIAVNPRNTSKKCPECGHIAAENRKRQVFSCLSCGYATHADLVGAINILAAGHAVSACGESTLVDSMKQEPLGVAA
jgi:putative transposase